jgi:hypothetical protein
MLAIQHEYMPDRYNDIYDNKMKEYFQYCDYYCNPLDYYNKVLVLANKLYCFMFYQPFQNQKKRGEKVTKNAISSNPAVYKEITQKCRLWMAGNSNTKPQEA